MLVKKDTKILRGGLDVATEGANIVTDLFSKTTGAHHKDLKVIEVIRFNQEVKLHVIGIAMIRDTTGRSKDRPLWDPK